MLRQLLVFSAFGVASLALSAPAMASEISGPIAISGSIYYTDDGGAFNFMSEAASNVPRSLAAFAPAGISANDVTLTDNFVYNGNISPAVFAATIGGQRGILTLDSITSLASVEGGLEVALAGTFDQAGYAQEMATASFLINSQYVGDNVDLMMFSGIAQLTPPATPEPASVAMLGTGMLALAGAGFFRKRLTAHPTA